MLKPKWQEISSNHLFRAFLAGILLALSRLPLHTGFLVFWALIPLLMIFEKRIKSRQLIYSALVFSTTYTLVSLHWISLVTVPGFLGMFILFGLYFSLLFLILKFFWWKLPNLKYLSFILIWISFEYLQNFGEFRFPWFNLGYSLEEYLPLIQAADLGGIYLISLLIILVNILIFRMRKDPKKSVILLVILILVWSGYGIFRKSNLEVSRTNKKIAIIQVSVPQNKKWEESFLQPTLDLYEEFTMKAAGEEPALIIWPESALPVYILKQFKYRRFVQNLARKAESDIFLGMPNFERAGEEHPENYKFYNAATKFGKNGKIAPHYEKNILVPFGERIPFLDYFPFLWKLQLGQANWEYGTENIIFQIDEYKFSPLICFEIAFDKLTSRMTQQGIDFIVNLTNDAWFYRSAGTFQHAVMTKFRAIETRKQIFRAANTGYSLVVNPIGEISQRSELFEKTILTEKLQICKSKSIYAYHLAWFPLIFPLAVIVLFMAALISGLKPKS